MSRTYEWYWRTRDGEADCGIYYEDRPGHAYSVCRAPRYAKESEWAEFAAKVCALLNDAERRASQPSAQQDGCGEYDRGWSVR